MIVADTSALISLEIADCLGHALEEFDISTTEIVIDELEDTATFDDSHGRAADRVLDMTSDLLIHPYDSPPVASSRIDAGEGSCIALISEIEPDFFLTDDLRALPELERLVDVHVAISPILIKALVTRDVLTQEDPVNRLEQLTAARGWLGTPIYRRAKRIFESDR